MKVLLSSLLLASLCALSSWSVPSATQVVTQTPDVSVMEGETVIITCCWRVESERLTVAWLKYQESIMSEVLLKNDSEGPQWSGRRNCSNLSFATITTEDSGRYTCRVTEEIPVYNQLEGNGTVITVTSRDNTTKNNLSGDEGPGAPGGPVPVALIVSVAVVAALLLLTLACFYTLRRRQVSVQAARVIYEVPHIDSEVADMDKHSTSSSRGSSQWCQVPVYESFDYFERVQTKESE